MRVHSAGPWKAMLVTGIFGLMSSTGALAQTTRVSLPHAGGEANGASQRPAVGGDGRFVVFSSAGTNLTAEAVPGTFLRDRQLNTTVRLSGSVRPPGISGDGRYVLHAIPRSGEPEDDWAVLDRQGSLTETVLPVGGSAGGTNYVSGPALALNGRHVAFFSDRVFPQGAVFGRYYAGIFVRDLDDDTQVCAAYQSTAGVAGNQVFAIENELPGTLAVSRDGRYVAYAATATNLVTGDANGVADVFVHDCTLGTTERVSVGSGGGEGNAASLQPAISGDGRYIVFRSSATNLTIESQAGIFVRDRVAGITTRLPIPSAGSPPDIGRSLVISEDGRYVALVSIVAANQYQILHYDRASGALVRADVSSAGVPGPVDTIPGVAIGMTADGRYVGFSSPASTLVATDLNAVADVFLRDVLDPDGDSVPSEWETFFGFDPNSAADGATDADGDGLSNAQEFANGSHPRGVPAATRYFAEGATSDFFATRIAVANPSASLTAKVLLRYLRGDSTFRTTLVSIPPREVRKIAVELVPGMLGAEFSTVIESDQPVVADRLMSWQSGQAYGTHAETAVTAPAATWYLAEGSTAAGFNLFYLFQNPGDTTAQVEVTYLLPSGAPLVRTYPVAARSRFNIWVNTIAALSATDVSAVVRVLSGPNIIVERAMYLSRGTQVYAAGHESAGVTAPATEWTFAEGATGPFFDLFLLAANPNSQAANIEASYLLPDGSTLTKAYVVPPNARFNIWVDEETFAGVKSLADTAVSVVIRSTNAVPIVAERAMWWPGTSSQWFEAHNSAGATSTATRWAFADGEVTGAPANADTYVLIANRSAFAGQVRVTLLFADGTAPAAKTFTVPATSRFNVHVRSQFPSAVGKAFGAIVESTGALLANLVVERAIYNDAGGVTWAAGANALATPLP